MARNFYRIEELPAGFGPCSLTIGNFDGVHRGHRAILQRAAAHARLLGIESVALTFDPHPLAVVAPDQAPRILTTVAERARRMRAVGIDRVVVLPFTRELSRLTPAEFVRQAIVEKLAARRVIVGDNFRFGRRQEGNAQELQRLGKEFGFETEVVCAIEIAGGVASSSRLREVLARGEMRTARHLLGRPFSLSGKIVRGAGIGSRQTVPTLNLQPDSQALPADGVYVSLTQDADGGRCWESISNVGVRPTFDGAGRTVETYLLNEPNGEFPQAVELYFLRRIRAERRFASAERLKAQILADVRLAKRYFAKLRAVRNAPAGERLCNDGERRRRSQP